MPYQEKFVYSGYSFNLLINNSGRSYVLIDEYDEIDNPDYTQALLYVLGLLPYFQAVGDMNEYGKEYYGEMRQINDIDWKTYPPVLLTIKAYENNLVPVREDSYKIAVALRDGILPPLPLEEPQPVKRAKPGYVYLVQSVSGHYKIGRAVNPQDRIKTFNVKLPFEVELLHVIASNDYETLEKTLHQHFDTQRVNGEWFNLSDDDVTYIKSLPGSAS